jgi:hypothetical protein
LKYTLQVPVPLVMRVVAEPWPPLLTEQTPEVGDEDWIARSTAGGRYERR